MNTVLPAVTDRQFDRLLEKTAVPVLIEFWKPGCGHCRALMTELERVQETVGSSLLIFTMNVEENPQIPAELEVVSLPALALYRNGEFSKFIGGIGKSNEIIQQLGL